MKHVKLFIVLNYFWNICSIIVFGLLGKQFVDLLFQENPYMSNMSGIINLIGFAVFILISSIISLIIHESGHLLLGLNAGLTFMEFNILMFSIYLEGDKIKTKRVTQIAGIGGYCNLYIDEHSDYKPNKVSAYFLGGILMNFFITGICASLLFLINNIWMKYILIIFAVMNFQLGVSNMIPQITLTGMESDMLKVINQRDDPNYIKVLGKLQRIMLETKNGKPLQELDITCPVKFTTYGEILLGILYLDFIIAQRQFQKVSVIIEQIIREGGDILSKQNKMLLSVQSARSEIATTCDKNRLKTMWTKEFKKYVEITSQINPVFLGCNYAFIVLVENDNKTAKKILKQVDKLSTEQFGEAEIEECKYIIQLVNKRE